MHKDNYSYFKISHLCLVSVKMRSIEDHDEEKKLRNLSPGLCLYIYMIVNIFFLVNFE